jgi:hypothetical protein
MALRLLYEFLLGTKGAGPRALSPAYMNTQAFQDVEMRLLDALRRGDLDEVVQVLKEEP